MALTAKFVADFSSFYDATQKAEVSLKGFDAEANKVNKSINRFADQFSGRKLIQEAQLMAAAIEKIGGASNLTEKELQQVAQKATDAAAKMRLIGEKVPADIQNLANQLKPLPTSFDDIKGAVLGAAGALGLTFGAGAIISGIKAQIAAALEYADQLSNLSASTSVSVQGLQRLEAIGVTAGVSMSELAGAVNTLQKRLDDPAARKALSQMGLDYAYIRSLNPEDQFLAIARAVDAIRDPVARANAGAALFKGTWATIAPAMKGNIDDIIANTTRMSDAQVKALDDAGDQWDLWYLNTKRSIRGFLGELVIADQKFQEAEFLWNKKTALPTLPAAPVARTGGGASVTDVIDPTMISELQVYGMTLEQNAKKATTLATAETAAAAATVKYANDVTASLERIRQTQYNMGAVAVAASQNVAGFNIRMSEAVVINRDFSTQLTQSTIKADAFGHVLSSNVMPSLQGIGGATYQAGLAAKDTASKQEMLNSRMNDVTGILGGIQTGWAQMATVGAKAVQGITNDLISGNWVGAITKATVALSGFIAKMITGSEESKKVSPIRDEFFKLQGGLETLNPKVQALTGNLTAVQAVFDAKTVQQYQTAIANLERILAQEEKSFDTLTDSAEDYADALKKLPSKIPIDIRYTESGAVPGSSGSKVPGYAGGTEGKFVDFGAGSLVMLHGKEAVVPEGDARALSSGGAVAGGGGVVSITINAQGAFFDTPGDLQRLADKVNDALTAKYGLTNRNRAA